MGCGVSTMAADCRTLSRDSSSVGVRGNRPAAENKKIVDVDDDNVSPACAGPPEKMVNQLEEHEMDGENNGRDDSFKGARSPSFREYCNMTDLPDSPVKENPSSGENIKSGDDEDTITLNKQQKEEVTSFNKGPEMKKRRGRWGRPRKKRSFLSSWYHHSNASSNRITHGQNQVAGITA